MTIPSTNNIQFASARLIDDGVSGSDTANNDGSSVPIVKVESANLLDAAHTTPSFYGSAIAVPAVPVASSDEYANNTQNNHNTRTPIEVVPLPASRRRNNNIPTAYATPITTTHPRRSPTSSRDRVLPERVQKFKQTRKRSQAAALIAGGIVGGVLLGPLGVVLFGFAAHGTTKSIGRARQMKLERAISAEQAYQSSATQAM